MIRLLRDRCVTSEFNLTRSTKQSMSPPRYFLGAHPRAGFGTVGLADNRRILAITEASHPRLGEIGLCKRGVINIYRDEEKDFTPACPLSSVHSARYPS